MDQINIRVKKNKLSFLVEDSKELHQYVDYNFWSDIYSSWETSTFKFLDQYLVKDMDYLDIGAWVGPTVLYSSFLSRNVIAVEPDPVASKILQSNIALNSINNVTIINKAASKLKSVSIEPHEFYGDSMTRTVQDSDSGIKVNTIGVDELCSMGNYSLIKIDIEGYEFDLVPDYSHIFNDIKVPLLISLHSDFVDNHKEKLNNMIDSLSGIKNVFDESGKNMDPKEITPGFGSYLFVW